MEFDTFAKTTVQHWNTYYRRIQQGNVRVDPALFPSELVLCRFGGALAFELIGCVESFQGLRTTTLEGDVNAYLGQYEELQGVNSSDVRAFATIPDNSKGFSLSGLVLTARDRLPRIRARYPSLTSLGFNGRSVIVSDSDTDAPILHIGSNCDDVVLEDIFLLNGGRARPTRIRYVSVFGLFKAEQTRQSYKRALLDRFPFDGPRFSGLQRREGHRGDRNAVAAQFASRLLTSGTQELDLSEFLRAHEGILKRSFGYTELLFEPYLEWQDGTPSNTSVAYNPDFMGRRPDGYWDFIELKLPLRLVRRLTRGEGAHSRFSQSAYEAISQVSHYENYFTYPANAAWAKNRYGIRIKNPAKIVIVGNSENTNKAETMHALISAPQRTEVYDYDSLIDLYLRDFSG